VLARQALYHLKHNASPRDKLLTTTLAGELMLPGVNVAAQRNYSFSQKYKS
jgi:hypothetical protein